MSNKGYVYLVGDWGRDGVYKIGVTRGTIERRIKKLQTGNSGEIYIVDYYRTDHPFFIEKWLHTKYCGGNILNEWFNLSLEDVLQFKKDCEFYENLYKISEEIKKSIGK